LADDWTHLLEYLDVWMALEHTAQSEKIVKGTPRRRGGGGQWICLDWRRRRWGYPEWSTDSVLV